MKGCLLWAIGIILFLMFGGVILAFTAIALNILAPVIVAAIVVGGIIWLVRYFSLDNNSTTKGSRRGRRGH